MVATVRTAETSQEQLAELMVGRHVALKLDKTTAEPGAAVLEIRDLTLRDGRGTLRLDHVGFDVRAGEIVGIAGVAGNGQSELLEIIAGMRRPSSGTITFG
ncbi:ATP-binding cassette domain-containing protein, partial [Klebsiella aerogenes]|uniref:ATP-binding cassette domain-containing protein n=1 Tax=Klebsiella aerogenes TaxID=548 RepID=UPI0021D0DC0B